MKIEKILYIYVEVYGSIVWSSSGYDCITAKRQFPAFRYDWLASNTWFFLRDISCKGQVGFCNNRNGGFVANATESYRIRPRFILA